MKIVISHNEPRNQTGRYGIIYKDVWKTATERLSPEALKTYVDMSLNQDGWDYRTPIPSGVQEELERAGYLVYSRSGDATFYTMPQPG